VQLFQSFFDFGKVWQKKHVRIKLFEERCPEKNVLKELCILRATFPKFLLTLEKFGRKSKLG
jgi:hypothetical protein